MKRCVKLGLRRKKPLNRMLRVVLDTNVFISASFRRLSPIPNQIYQALKTKQFILITSPSILEEIEEVSAREKIMRLTGMPENERMQFIENLIEIGLVVPGNSDVQVIQDDPDDNKFLSAAIEGFADYIVSGDDDLLNLREYENIRIVSPNDFLTILEREGNIKE